MKNLKLADLDRPIKKVIEHFQDALFHLEQSNLPESTKSAVHHAIQNAADEIRLELTGQPKEVRS